MLVHWIWFATRPGLGDHGRKALLEAFGSPEELYEAEPEDLRPWELNQKVEAVLLDKDLKSAEKVLEDCRNHRIHILTYQDAGYPSRLRHISDPPMVLYYKGSLPDFDGTPMIGVVGTRRASTYGLSMAKRLGYEIAACGGVVVSGLATGIDGMAMKGALSAGGCAVGILGSGADIIYPYSNRALFEDTRNYGCILSEFVPGTPPLGRNFPRRNRIISGISNGVLVVEAPEQSGALITANLAADQGRDVFTIPSNVDNPAGKGTNNLLKTGAIPVETGWDILEEYIREYPDKIHRAAEYSRLRAYPDEIRQAQQEGEKHARRKAKQPKKSDEKKPEEHADTKKDVDKKENEPYIDVNEIESALSPDQRVIVTLLKEGQRLVDDVIAESGLPAGTVMACLTILEVQGIIRRLPGKLIALAGRK